MAPRRDSTIIELLSTCCRLPKHDSTLHNQKSQSWAKLVEQNGNKTRALEEELIKTKIGMATAKSREDYLLLEIQRLKKSLAQKDSVIEDLQDQLATSHGYRYNDCPPFKNETAPEVGTTTYIVPVHGSIQRDAKTIENETSVNAFHMPIESSLDNHDETTVVSALTFYSGAFGDVMNEEDLSYAFPSVAYQESLRDESQGARRIEFIASRQPSCASGIAFMMNYWSTTSVSPSRGSECFDDAEHEKEQEEFNQRIIHV